MLSKPIQRRKQKHVLCEQVFVPRVQRGKLALHFLVDLLHLQLLLVQHLQLPLRWVVVNHSHNPRHHFRLGKANVQATIFILCHCLFNLVNLVCLCFLFQLLLRNSLHQLLHLLVAGTFAR